MNKKNESGRSMVEILGVLAVIGVLSVAGIAGYTTAMRSYRTNEIVNAASMLYVMAMAKNQGNGADTNYTELGTPPSGATLAYSASDKMITITFPNTDDCTMAANKLGDKATADCANKTLTVNFGETTTSEEPALLDNTEWCQGSCPDGYAFVSGPDSGCAQNIEQAIEFCLSLPGYFQITTAKVVEDECVAGGPVLKYFLCSTTE